MKSLEAKEVLDVLDVLIEERVFQHLIQDIGLSNTRKLVESLDEEWLIRIANICQAIEDQSLEALAVEAATLKSIAQVSGAYKLVELLIKLERAAIRQCSEAFALAQNALNLAQMTRFAYLDLKLAG